MKSLPTRVHILVSNTVSVRVQINNFVKDSPLLEESAKVITRFINHMINKTIEVFFLDCLILFYKANVLK